MRCHTVPQFYLKRFLPSGSNLFWVYDRKNSSFREQSPINTAVIGDYYLSSPDKEGKKDARMEQFFSLLEGMVKPVLDTWISDPSKWRDDDKPVVAMFLSYIFTRSTRAIEAVKEINNAGTYYTIDKLQEASKDLKRIKKLYEDFCASEQGKDCKIAFEEFSSLMSDPLRYVTARVNEKHAIGDSLIVSERIYRALMEMTWSIWYIDRQHFFVTSDSPLNIFVQTDEDKAIFGGGLSLPNAQVAFPLSPKICLWLTRSLMKRYCLASADFVTEINRRTICMAERYVIATFKSNRIYKIVKEFANLYKNPKIDAELIKQRLRDAGVGNDLGNQSAMSEDASL